MSKCLKHNGKADIGNKSEMKLLTMSHGAAGHFLDVT